MKRLYLVRHAKSDWSDMRLRDHDRPLNARGRAALHVMGAHLASLHIKPDLVLCSTAVRTRETLEGLQSAAGSVWSVAFEKQIYEASKADLVALVRSQDDALSSLMLIGHNPGMQELAIALAGEGSADALERVHHKVPTGAFMALAFNVSAWRDVAFKMGQLTRFVRPKSLTKA